MSPGDGLIRCAFVFRLYSEHVLLRDIDAPLLRALSARDVELSVAVFAGQEAVYRALAQRAAGVELKLVLWPLLSDARGRHGHEEHGAKGPTEARMKPHSALLRLGVE